MTDYKTGEVTVKIGDTEQKFIANAKDFATGSKGFFASGKVQMPDGKKYQVICNIVEVGSKPKV